MPFRIGLLGCGVLAMSLIGWPAEAKPADPSPAELTLAEQRRRFQEQELTTSNQAGWLFAPGNAPRIIWRDVDEVRRLHRDSDFQLRWFGAERQEFAKPDHPGRWIASVTGTAPNGTPLRRALTFFAFPPNIADGSAPDLTVAFPKFPGPDAPAPWTEHQAEFNRIGGDLLRRALIGSETGAVLIAGIFEAQPLGRPARHVESASVLNDAAHLALKLQQFGLSDRVRDLQPPRRRVPPTGELREGSWEAAGVTPDAKARIDALCEAWAEDTGEPFVTLVARRGVIVTHRAFGKDAGGEPISLDYRCWVASLTKTVTALMFSQLVDQGFVAWDDPLSKAFPDFPAEDPHVPTFRQCLNHTSGLSGHGDFGGMKNPHLENIILNGIDVNQPNRRYEYCGLGFELVAKAMEMLTGKCAARIYDEHLFQPLGFGDVVMGNASSDGEFTARELAILAQWVANRGSYGGLEFMSADTFESLLPRPVRVAEQNYAEDEGLGLHWVRHRKPGADPNSKLPEDLLFGPRTLGHGSFSSCVLVVDPDQQLVIAQVRRQSGARHGEWSPKFFQTIAAVIDQGSPAPATVPDR